jgi:hypothetical protein
MKSRNSHLSSNSSVSTVQKPTDPFVSAFLATGQQVEYRASEVLSGDSRLVFPKVNGREYEVVIVGCACAELTLHYVPDPQRRINYFYSLCSAHGLQPLGRAIRNSGVDNSDAAHRRRKSGATTSAWYRNRGW